MKTEECKPVWYKLHHQDCFLQLSVSTLWPCAHICRVARAAFPSTPPCTLLPGRLSGAWTDAGCTCVSACVGSEQSRDNTSSAALYAHGLVKQSHTSSGSLLLREEEVDPLGYGLASLGWEQSFLFGHVDHRLGHLIQRRLVRLQAPRHVGVARAQLDVAVLQRQERHEEVDQVPGYQLTLSKPTWGGESHGAALK